MEEHRTVVSHHRRHAPQDEIREVEASMGITRFGCSRAAHAHRGPGKYEVESLMRNVAKEEQRLAETPVERRDPLGGPPQARPVDEAAVPHASAGFLGGDEDGWGFDPGVED